MEFEKDMQDQPTPQGSLPERLLANIRVPRKISLIILAMLLGTVWVFATAMQGVANMQTRKQTVFESVDAPIAALNDVYAALSNLRADLSHLKDRSLLPEEKTLRLEKVATAEGEIAVVLQQYQINWLKPVDLAYGADLNRAKQEEIDQALNALRGSEYELFAEFNDQYAAYDKLAGAYYQHIKSNRYDDLTHKRVDDAVGNMQETVRQLMSIHAKKLAVAEDINQASYRSFAARMGFTLATAIALGLLFASWVARSIVSRLNALGDGALALQYDLLDRRAAVTISGEDEIALVARSFNVMSNRLREIFADLERKVKERTVSLSLATAESAKRAQQFQTVTQIAQRITSERDLDILLDTITEVISKQFAYYHVAVYLNDDMQEFTAMSAVSSEDGKRMMARGHKLPVKLTSLIGYVAKTGNRRSSADAPEEAYTHKSLLPDTRSAIALPLKARDQVIGVLDVQSERESAFDQTDIEALTALANQVTIAIQNTRLFTETQTALAESQLLYGTIVKQTWKSAMRSSSQIGYRYSGAKPTPLQKEISTVEIREALENDNVALTHPSRRRNENALALPLKLRETTIGVINVNFPAETEVGEDEIDVLVAASQRVALALENASLLEESQRRAKREQTISEMSAKIGSGTEVEAILKTAIRELSGHISSAQIMIELASEEEQG